MYQSTVLNLRQIAEKTREFNIPIYLMEEKIILYHLIFITKSLYDSNSQHVGVEGQLSVFLSAMVLDKGVY